MIYTLFAGVNGSGKTSLFTGAMHKRNLGIRINTDEIVDKIGSWQSREIQFKAAREAVRMVKYCLDNKLNFNQETTLAGKTILKTLIEAKKLGYTVNMNYVGVSCAEIAVNRVMYRVSIGGHGIPKEDIVKRYSKSLENLVLAIKVCDNVNIYDNSKKMVLVCRIYRGKILFLGDNPPLWVINLINRL